jgi:histone deacetylase complex regulatory component SIN3
MLLSVPDQQPAEFDHAVLYVAKIKQTFANDPQTYKV